MSESTVTDRVLAALAAAGYPAPRVFGDDGYTALVWGTTATIDQQPWAQFTVYDTGPIVVVVDRYPDAIIGADHIDAWLTVLHPVIADIITATTPADPVPPPPALPFGSLPPFVFLDDTLTEGTYAVFADHSRLWVSAGDAHTAITTLLDTIRGYTLGITLHTVVAIATTSGTVYLNPTQIEPASTATMTGYQSTLAAAEHRWTLPQPPGTHHLTPAHAIDCAERAVLDALTAQAHAAAVTHPPC